MSGDAPQPGETPHSESASEQSWWPGETDPNRPRHPRRRPPQTPGHTGTLLPQREQPYAPETAEVPDAPLKQRPAEAAQELRTEPAGVERDHNRADAFRYDPLRPPAGYASQSGVIDAPEPPAEVTPPPAAEDQPSPGPPPLVPPRSRTVTPPQQAPGATPQHVWGATPQYAPEQEPAASPKQQESSTPASPALPEAETSAANGPSTTPQHELPTSPKPEPEPVLEPEPVPEPESDPGPATPPQHWVGASQRAAYDNSAELSTETGLSTAAEASLDAGSSTGTEQAEQAADGEQATPTEQAMPAEQPARSAGVEHPTDGEAPPTSADPAPEPDVMVLPEPDARNRPTVSLDRSPVPGQARLQTIEPLPRPTGDPATDARLEKLENSPFWLDNPEHGGARRLPEVSSHVGPRRRTRKRAIRKPGPALFALITLALVATFFAWVSAEPFWLAVGHGDRGYATTTACSGSGVAQRCAGRFDAADGSFAVTRVALLGVGTGERARGSVTSARMVSADSRMAYLGSTGLLVQLRWILGFALVLICGYGIATLTGARRLEDPRARRLVTLASLFAPVILLAGFLAAAY